MISLLTKATNQKNEELKKATLVNNPHILGIMIGGEVDGLGKDDYWYCYTHKDVPCKCIRNLKNGYYIRPIIV